MVEQLAREQVPANTATYIAKKAFSESILGMGNFGSLKKGAIGQKVDEQAENITIHPLFQKQQERLLVTE